MAARLLHTTESDSGTTSRSVIPGDGQAPVAAILRKLAEKQYAGPLSAELFLAAVREGDPFAVASRIKEKSRR